MQGSRDMDIREVQAAGSGAAWAPPPRWARRAAAVVFLSTVPSAIWRTSMALGVPVGADGPYVREHYGSLGWCTAYVVGLSVLLMGLAALTFGLVRPWGEIAPRWMPVIGGRPVRRLAAVIPAGAGAVALTLLWCAVFSGIDEIFDVYGLDGAERVVVLLCYAPMLLWGPLLGAVTVSYAKRARTGRASPVQDGRQAGPPPRPRIDADPATQICPRTEAGSSVQPMTGPKAARTIGTEASEPATATSRRVLCCSPRS
jgi:hypothetical protein